jgi:hypothetical protein
MAASVECITRELGYNNILEDDIVIPTLVVQESQEKTVQRTPRALTHMTVNEEISEMSLEDAYHQFVLDGQASIPFFVWLLENPASPIALPGSINLHGHDCLHLLLNRGVSSYDEAFVVGFTMGNSDEVESPHLSMLKFFARFIYPKPYRFSSSHLRVFDLGMMYGKKVPYRNIHKVLFDNYAKEPIGKLREYFGISLSELKLIWDMETKTYAR